MRCALALVLVAIAAGCESRVDSAVSEGPPTSTSGSLTVAWTVVGSTNPSACTTAGASAVEVTVVNNVDNSSIGTFQQSCNAFSLSVALEAGLYVASARLLDAGGARISRDVLIPSFTMNVKSELTEPIDFPATSLVPLR